MTEAEGQFDSFLAGISDVALRVRIERSAMEAWRATALASAADDERWRAALFTAEARFGCARAYYPELFQRKAQR